MTLTKQLNFSTDVLSVLRNMEWLAEGTLGKITSQLDRKLYDEVNKALSAMGGKWNKKAGAHVFDADPRPQVDGLLESGSLIVERDGFFETPEPVVLRMLQLVPIPKHNCVILEPSAGKGAILKVLLEHADLSIREFDVIEKNEARRAFLKEKYGEEAMVINCDDFMKYKLPEITETTGERVPAFHYDLIYMNPPFEENQDIDHVMHAYYLLSKHGTLVSVMSEGPFFRTDSVATDFRNWLSLVGGVSEKLPEGSFKESGTGVNTRLIVIPKQ